MTIKVNILPREKEPAFRLDPLTFVLLVALLAGNLAMIAYARVLSRQVTGTRTELTGVEAQSRRLEEQLPVLAQREERVRKLEVQLQSIRDLRIDPVRYSHLLTLIARALPDSVWLESLAVDPSHELVTVRGTVADPLPMGTLARLVAELRRGGVFDHTELKTAVRKDRVFTFELEAHYKPQAAAKEL